jgi:hypothetical protein
MNVISVTLRWVAPIGIEYGGACYNKIELVVKCVKLYMWVCGLNHVHR